MSKKAAANSQSPGIEPTESPVAPAANPLSEASANGGLDVVREILFGEQNRQAEKATTELRDRFEEESAKLRREQDERLTKMENLFDSKVKELEKILDDERQERRTAMEDLLERLEQDLSAMRRSLRDESERARDDDEKILSQLEATTTDLRQRVQDVGRHVGRVCNSELVRIRRSKLDSTTLAAMLMDLVSKLERDEQHFEDGGPQDFLALTVPDEESLELDGPAE